jgi:uncharacterized repeat protein (TIGR01451 family)
MARAPGPGVPGAIIRSPRSLIRAVIAVGAVSSTLGASLWVASVAGPAIVALPALAGPSYARDVSGFHPVSRHLSTDIVSPPTVVPTPTPAPTPHTPSSKPIDSQAPATTPTPINPTTPPPPPPSLSVAIAANSALTHPNKAITFTITITNAGPGVATDLVIESHVPDGATLSSWMCNGTSFQAMGADHFTCGTLGDAPNPEHAHVYAVPALATGATITESFTVQVDHNVDHNSAIVDHAHAYASNADLADSNEVAVIVK